MRFYQHIVTTLNTCLKINKLGGTIISNHILNTNKKVYDILNDTHTDLLWGLRYVKLEYTWDIVTQDDLNKIRVAIIDSGVDYDHEDLKRYVAKGYNFVKGNCDISDQYGHGTCVAGIIGAEKNNNKGIAGVASGVQIVPLKVFNDNGIAEINNVIDAIEWCIDNSIDIINLSIGYSMEQLNFFDFNIISLFKREQQIIERAIKKNIVIVAAVGNNSNRTMDFPAICEGVIPVASYGIRLDPISIFPSIENNRTNEMTIFAPGEYIFTTCPNSTYGYFRGSSFACAFVSGAVALIRSIRPDITPEQIHKMMLESSNKVSYEDMHFKTLDIDQIIKKIR